MPRVSSEIEEYERILKKALSSPGGREAWLLGFLAGSAVVSDDGDEVDGAAAVPQATADDGGLRLFASPPDREPFSS